MNNDVISRSALKEWLTRPTGFRTNCEDCTSIDCLDCIIGEAIDNAPAVDAGPQWISVKDRLPMEYTDVLVCLEDGRVHIGYRFNSCEFPGVYWDFCSTRHRVSLPKVPFGGAVTHWMPLPEPPKEG